MWSRLIRRMYLPLSLHDSKRYSANTTDSYGQYATDSAFPHADSPLPLNLYFAWALPVNDDFWYNAMKESVAILKAEAIREGIYKDSFTKYPNYAITGTTAEELYGTANTARLRAIRQQVDPDGVMELAGGFDLS